MKLTVSACRTGIYLVTLNVKNFVKRGKCKSRCPKNKRILILTVSMFKLI